MGFIKKKGNKVIVYLIVKVVLYQYWIVEYFLSFLKKLN